MNFDQIKATLRSLRFRLMLLNAIVVLLASMGTLFGLRAGIRFALVHELDQILSEDLEELKLTLAATGDPKSSSLSAQLDRKARGHIQHRWFVQIHNLKLPSRSPEERLDGLTPNDRMELTDQLWQSVNVPPELELRTIEASAPETFQGYRILDRMERFKTTLRFKSVSEPR